MLMNLLSNAVEAVPDGEVSIRTENRYLDRDIRGYDRIEEGDYVVLTVSDTGTGIPAESIDKILSRFTRTRAWEEAAQAWDYRLSGGRSRTTMGTLKCSLKLVRAPLYAVFSRDAGGNDPARAEDPLSDTGDTGNPFWWWTTLPNSGMWLPDC